MKLRLSVNRAQDPLEQREIAPQSRGRRFRALLVSPNRNLAKQFMARAAAGSEVTVIEHLDSYPRMETLAALGRSGGPELVLMDLTTDLALACRLIRSLASLCPAIHVIGLHAEKNAEALMSALRVGATEFLYAPFEPAEMCDALARIDRLRRAGSAGAESGRVIAFSSAKPGAGATTLATHTALTLRSLTGQRVLLIDLNLWGGLIGADIMPSPEHSVLDALEQAESLNVSRWSYFTHYAGSIDLLPAPAVPGQLQVRREKLHALLASARQAYDWIVLDLPTVFHSFSQMVLNEVDQGFVVITTELPSLHLARRSAEWLRQCGFGRERYQILVNRAVFSGALDRRVLEDVLSCPVAATLPNDYATLHKLERFGETPGAETELGASLRRFAALLAGVPNAGSTRFSSACGLRPALAR